MAPPARVTSMTEFSTVAGLLHARVVAVSVRLEADAIDRRIHHRVAHDLLDLLGERSILLQVDGFAAEALGLRQPLRNHVADDHHGRAQQLAGCRGGAKPTGPAPAM